MTDAPHPQPPDAQLVAAQREAQTLARHWRSRALHAEQQLEEVDRERQRLRRLLESTERHADRLAGLLLQRASRRGPVGRLRDAVVDAMPTLGASR